MFFNRLSTRGRAIFTTIFTASLFFLIVSPIYKLGFEALFPPSAVSDISVEQKNREIALEWSANKEQDIKGYSIYLDGVLKQTVEKNQLSYIITELENGVEYTVSVAAVDFANATSSPIVFKATPSDKVTSFTENVSNESVETVTYILGNSVLIVLILFVLNLWVLFFNVKRNAVMTVGAYPSVAVLPYLILTISILLTINNPINKLIFAVGIAVGYAVITYLLILTSNILNGSLQITLPLEQAAKASQFIFSLISAYLMMIFILGANLNIFLRLVYLLPFIFYFSYSGIWFLKGLNARQVLMKSLGITLMMALTVIVIAFWPIPNIYAILSIAIVYYVLLNIALENRAKLGNNFWVEYSILLALIVVLLFTNSYWGIIGSII